MAYSNTVTVLLPGQNPLSADLDSYGRDCVLMGRGSYHGDNGPPNDIRIDSSVGVISRAHCSFRRDPHGDWYIMDDNSLNGLRYHGQAIKTHRLSDGDKIYIGDNPEQRVVILFARQELRRNAVQDHSMMRSYPLRGKNRFVIGRAEDCDIVISHPTVSRNHCIILRENGKLYITDNNSTNGVILNSETLKGKAPLHRMDRISIAGIDFVVGDDCLYSKESRGGVSVSAERVSKRVGKSGQRKTILDDVSLFIEPNQFVAIIGGSGAGKTTLLNCLSGMSSFNAGEVRINGESIRTGAKSLRSLMGYVPQQDIVYDQLTLERMLYYSAKLRMPPDSSEREIKAKIDETLATVELSAHRKTMISKLSGGQRKRASIAVELLASPKLFFLDEPSSGLDPGTEKHLMQMLKKLASSGRTVIMVTHTVQNIDLCDNVICMGRGGKLCFSGSPQEALAFFGKPSLTDVYDVLNDHPEETARRYRGYSEKKAVVQTPASGEANRAKRKRGTLWRDFRVMTRRYIEILWNQRFRLIFLLLVLPMILTLLVCLAMQADGGLNTLLQRCGVSVTRESFPFLVGTDTLNLMFAFSCAAFWTGIFNSVQEISKERSIYERERFAGAGIGPYVMSKFLPMFLLCVIQSAVMLLLLCIMTNTSATIDGNVNNSVSAIRFSMRSDGLIFSSMTFETYLTTLLCMLSAMCLGLLVSSVASNEMAMVLCPVCLMPQILFSGVVQGGEMSGLSGVLSNIISCRWSTLAYMVSTRINDSATYYQKYKYDMGTWTGTEYEAVGLGSVYDEAKTYLFGMNGVTYSWLMLTLLSVLCVILAVVILSCRNDQKK
ncbi:MAG: FHA domain-containing protein [Oscillospiraceae bacterium]|nr:FHA domain-containing protein [Oscillospiraceae bacterium]